MISIIDRDVPEAIPAWYGGPVDTTTAIILHDKVAQTGDTEISPGINLSTKGKILDSLIEHGSIALQNGMGSSSHPGHAGLSGSSVHPYRFLVGYAGWGAGQLDDELKGGSWLLCPLDRKLVFDTGWNDLWGACMAQIGMQKNPMVAAKKLSGIEYLN
jgi:putative transcriptional regulator